MSSVDCVQWRAGEPQKSAVKLEAVAVEAMERSEARESQSAAEMRKPLVV
jgi:hypothetical protein